MCNNQNDPSIIFTYEPGKLNLIKELDDIHDLHYYQNNQLGRMLYKHR